MTAKKTPQKTLSLDAECVGLQYHLTKSSRIMLQNHAPFECELKREPGNTNDENAIAVFVGSQPRSFRHTHIGYLRRQLAAVIAPALDEGKIKILRCICQSIEPHDPKVELRIDFTGKLTKGEIQKIT